MKLYNKNTRGAEKRTPSLSLLASVAVFVAVFLIGIWVLSPSTETASGYETSSDNLAATTKWETGQHTVEESLEKVDTPSATHDTEETQESLHAEEFEKSDETVSQESSTENNKLDADIQSDRKQESDPLDNSDIDAEAKVLDEQAVPGDKAELLIEKDETPGSSLITQAKESKEEKIQEVIQNEGTVDAMDIVDARKQESSPDGESISDGEGTLSGFKGADLTDAVKYDWELCTWANAQDYIPCLDNTKAIQKLKSRKHFQHYERHCPEGKYLPTCLIPLPEGYTTGIDWPESRDKIWHANVPHDKLVTYKQDQNWVKKKDDYLVFPGGGTQFKHGAIKYIESIQKTWPDITWGKHVRTVLDIGCGVASFGGFMFDKDVLTMSFAPKDEHEAQVQMALERGIPAILSVMGTSRLSFPSNSFDLLHCARCRVPWHADNGMLLLELNRILRPGGYFVWSATPVYRIKDAVEMELWKATKNVTDAMCWELLVRTKIDPDTEVGMAIFRKPQDNSCYDKRKHDEPPMCAMDDKADAAWYVKMNSCLHRIPTGDGDRGAEWPEEWPARLEVTPSWLSSVPKGLFGKPAFEEFLSDTKHWQHVVEKSYFTSLGITWRHIRNVLDMKAGYGGFATALSTQPLWVMNVVPTDEPDTLPIIYDRGLFGMYHDWCESFSTYPRTYDLLHAEHVFESVDKRCKVLNTLVEMDRILRPGGWAIFRDKLELMTQIEEIIKSFHWNVKYSYKQGTERLLAAQKGSWRPEALV